MSNSRRGEASVDQSWAAEPGTRSYLTGGAEGGKLQSWGCISFYCRARHVHVVELVALRRVAPRRAAQRPSGTAHSVRSARTGLSQRDKHHLQEIATHPQSGPRKIKACQTGFGW